MAEAEDEVQVVHSGYLWKAGYWNSAWKRRYFVLHKDGLLSYFKSELDKKPLGVIDLHDIYGVSKMESFSGSLIQISTKSRNWKISSELECEFWVWMNALTEYSTVFGKSQLNCDDWLANLTFIAAGETAEESAAHQDLNSYGDLKRGFVDADIFITEAKSQKTAHFGSCILLQNPSTWGEKDSSPRRSAITAAHCVSNNDFGTITKYAKVRVRIPIRPWKDFPADFDKYKGFPIANELYKTIEVAEQHIFIHHLYDGDWTSGYDVALIALPELLPMKASCSFDTCNYDTFPKTACVAGYPVSNKCTHIPYFSAQAHDDAEDRDWELYFRQEGLMVGYPLKTMGGFSGGAVIIDGNIVGIHNAANKEQPGHGFGTLFTIELKEWIEDAFSQWKNVISGGEQRLPDALDPLKKRELDLLDKEQKLETRLNELAEYERRLMGPKNAEVDLLDTQKKHETPDMTKYNMDLQPGWEAKWDIATNRPYWVNHNNRKSQWEDPRVNMNLWLFWAGSLATETAVRNYVNNIQESHHGGRKVLVLRAVMVANEQRCSDFLTSTLHDKFLFHGAAESSVANIQSEGLLMTYAASGGLGKGLYGCPDPRKAFYYSNYATAKMGVNQHGRFMFLGRYNCDPQNAKSGRGLYNGDPYNYEEFAVYDERHVVLLWLLKVELESETTIY